MKAKTALIVLILLSFTLSYPVFSQQSLGNWTQFRGTELNGIADNNDYPLTWNDSLNVSWKTEIHGKGWSSPVVFNDQVWLTTARPDGKEMFAVCMDLNTGKILYDIKVFEPDSIYRIHAVNSYATPTPVVEDGFVYVHFGRYGTACINTDNGHIEWKRIDLQCEHVQGPGASPVIFRDKLILHMEGIDVQYIIALDKRTGKTIWKTDRPNELYDKLPEIGKKAYITPAFINVNGRDLMISNGSAVCIAYDVETGEEVWRIVQGEDSTISMPFLFDGKVYFYTGFVTPPEGEKYCELIAVDPKGTGDIADSHVLWRFQSPPLQLLSPVAKDGLIYTIDSRSNLFCLDALTGKVIWSDRIRGKFNSSPIAAAGNIYFSSTRGDTYVFKQGKELSMISENSLDGEIWATPAFVDGSILMRTSKYLYRIGE